MFPDGAGVHDHHIGTLRFLHNAVTAHGQIPAQFFGIRLVLLAAVGFHIGGGGDILLMPVGRDFIAIGKLLLQLRIRNHIGLLAHVGISSDDTFSTINNNIFHVRFQAQRSGKNKLVNKL